MYIEKPDCVGDHEHNRYVDILLKDILVSNISEIILKHLDGNYKTGNWIFNEYTTEELRKLNTIMRTKNIETLGKRIKRFIDYLDGRSYYMKIFEQNKWLMMDDVVDEFSKNKLVLGDTNESK